MKFIIAVALALPAALHAQNGKAVYDKWCSGCHGDTGAGDGFGSKAMLPHPRDFTKGVYKIRTTASGEIPTDDDLRHIIEVGMPGTAMPDLGVSERDARDMAAFLGELR